MKFVDGVKKAVLQLGGKIQMKRLQRIKGVPCSSRNDGEKLIVSMTSWKMRIGNVCKVVESILNNSIRPDKIVINLSEEEFCNKNEDLPADLLALEQYGVIEINWVYANTKAFKKIIPTMKRYPDDIVLAIDDDFLYPKDLVETFLKEHKKYPDRPLSGNQVKINNTQAHCGCASLVSARFYGCFIDELLDEEILRIGADDVFYTFCAVLSGNPYQYVGRTYFHNLQSHNPSFALSESDGYDNDEMIRYLNNKIKRMYHLNLNDMNNPLFSFRKVCSH